MKVKKSQILDCSDSMKQVFEGENKVKMNFNALLNYISYTFMVCYLPFQTDCFYDSVKNLSWFDRLLNSRLEEKNKLIKSGTKKSQWLSTMRTIKSSGKTYSCGFTRYV